MANTKITTAVITADAITGALIADDVALGGNPTTTTQSAGNDTTRVATTAFVTAAIDNLIDSAPGTMNTLNEIAAAINDDANFNTTVTNLIASKAAISGQTFSGDIQATGVYVGSTNTSYDFYNNGTSYLNGAVTIDDALTVTPSSGENFVITRDSGGLYFGSSSNHNLRIITNNGERIRIGTDGKVGIGASTVDEMLHIEQSSGTTMVKTEVAANSVVGFNIKKTGSTTQEWKIVDGQTANGTLEIYDVTDSRSVMAFSGTGKVGIGTTSPSSKFHIWDGSAVDAFKMENYNRGAVWNSVGGTGMYSEYQLQGTAKFRMGQANHLVSGESTSNFAFQASAGDLIWATSTTERMRLTNAGNVGIGTGSSIDGKFHSETSTAGQWAGVFENTGGQGAGVLIKAAGDGGANPLLDVRNGTETVFTIMNANGKVTATNSANITQQPLTSDSGSPPSVAWNAAQAANAYHLTTENTTIAAPSNPVEGAIISIEIAQGGTARTIGWNTVFEFAASTAPTMTATANKTDIYTFRYNGSVWQEIGRVQNMAQT